MSMTPHPGGKQLSDVSEGHTGEARTIDTRHYCWNIVEDDLMSLRHRVETSNHMTKADVGNPEQDLGAKTATIVRQVPETVRLRHDLCRCPISALPDEPRDCIWTVDSGWHFKISSAIEAVSTLIKSRKASYEIDRKSALRMYSRAHDWDVTDAMAKSWTEGWEMEATQAIEQMETFIQRLHYTAAQYERVWKSKQPLESAAAAHGATPSFNMNTTELALRTNP